MGGKMSRDKGARGERAVATYLRANGWPDARRYLAGDGNQPGDIDAIPGVALEVKNCATYQISAWLRQAIDEAGPDRLPAVVMHPKGVALDNVADWWTVMRFEDFVTMLKAGES